MKIINPATEEIIAEVQEDTKDTLEKKFHLLQSAQKDWQKRTLQERIEMTTPRKKQVAVGVTG